MTRPWYSRLYHFVVDEPGSVLIVATPLVTEEPIPTPLTLVVPAKHVSSVLGRIGETHQGKRSLVVEGRAEREPSKAKPKRKR